MVYLYLGCDRLITIVVIYFVYKPLEFCLIFVYYRFCFTYNKIKKDMRIYCRIDYINDYSCESCIYLSFIGILLTITLVNNRPTYGLLLLPLNTVIVNWQFFQRPSPTISYRSCILMFHHTSAVSCICNLSEFNGSFIYVASCSSSYDRVVS